MMGIFIRRISGSTCTSGNLKELRNGALVGFALVGLALSGEWVYSPSV